jgi:hypothetical protein
LTLSCLPDHIVDVQLQAKWAAIELTYITNRRQRQLNILWTKVKGITLIAGIALGVMFGSVQKSKAVLYENYLPYYTYYWTYYINTGNTVYYGYAQAYLYYWWASFYSDYYGYQNDGLGYKADKKIATAYSFPYPTLTAKLPEFTAYTYWYTFYAYFGDYYYHHYVLGDV